MITIMKNKILTGLALSVILCLSSFGAKAQSVYIQDIIEQIDKNGQEFDAAIVVTGISHAPNMNPPSVSVLEGDYISMRATNCTYIESVEDGYLYSVHLEIDPALDFGQTLTSHIRFTFNLGSEKQRSVDFWTSQPGLSVGSVSPASQNIIYQQADLFVERQSIHSIRPMATKDISRQLDGYPRCIWILLLSRFIITNDGVPGCRDKQRCRHRVHGPRNRSCEPSSRRRNRIGRPDDLPRQLAAAP